MFLSIYSLSKRVQGASCKIARNLPKFAKFFAAVRSDLLQELREWNRGKHGKPSNPEFFASIFVVGLEKCVCSKKIAVYYHQI